MSDVYLYDCKECIYS